MSDVGTYGGSRFAMIVVMALLLVGCRDLRVAPIEPPGSVATPDSVDHALLTEVLAQVVDAEGYVDYAAVKEDDRLAAYLRHLAQVRPARLSEAGQVAFWINAYNAYVLHLVAQHAPVASIQDIRPTVLPRIPLVNSPFEIRFATVGGTDYTLNEIEHTILRERFDEPRIHFALVCAAVSCPPLRREAYTAARLDAQLDAQARAFLHDPTKNRVDLEAERLSLSRIFHWFGEDFGPDEVALQAFLAPYFEGEVRQKLEAGAFSIRYLSYDWRLNDQAGVREPAGS